MSLEKFQTDMITIQEVRSGGNERLKYDIKANRLY